MDSIIRHLPKGWEEKKIKQCFKFKNGKGFSGELREKADSDYCYPVYGGNGIIGYCNIPLLDKPTIIVGRVGEYCGNVFKTQEKSWVTDNAMLVSEVLLEDFDINFWTVMLNSLHFNHFSDSTGQPKITQGGIGAITVVYPKSATEQTATANILSKVDEAIVSVQNSIAVAERLKKSLMQNLLTGKMKPDGTFRTPEEFYIDEKFGKVPVGWEVKKLKDIASIQRGKFGHRPRNDERFYNGDFPFVQTSDVVESVLYLKSASQSLNELGASVSKRFPQNTIIMTIAANIGYVALTRYEVYFPDSLIGINANENIVKPTYLLFQLMGFKNVLDALATESAQKNINYSNLKSLPLLFPTNIEEQLQIAERIIKTFKVIEDNKSKIDILERLKKSLMQNLLTGKVRVIYT